MATPSPLDFAQRAFHAAVARRDYLERTRMAVFLKADPAECLRHDAQLRAARVQVETTLAEYRLAKSVPPPQRPVRLIRPR